MFWMGFTGTVWDYVALAVLASIMENQKGHNIKSDMKTGLI